MVVSNTSPLNYLVQIGAVDLLWDLRREIHVPRMVITELLDPAAPQAVREWAENLPDWLIVHEDEALVEPGVDHLHRGEAEAISVALRHAATLLLIDDLDGRLAARDAGLTVMGTLGVIDAAAVQGLTSFHQTLAALLATNFRAAPKLVGALLQRHGGGLP
jgi:predicted nucleic acid-binding protein